MKLYDYIILGAGASGLMLAYRMAKDSFFANKSILIIDKDGNKVNDRTWCYWEKDDGEWDDILKKEWTYIYFGSKSLKKTIDISPYKYKMIRSEDFYIKLWKTIKQNSNIEFVETSVKGIVESDTVDLETTRGTFKAKQLFNSIPNSDFLKQEKFPLLQQHFLGWFVKTETEVFDVSSATFMDFEIPQKGNTRFMYVLPMNTKTALFEYTLFSKDLLEISEYEDAIKNYLEKKNISDYEIVEVEKGSIPMTSYKFNKSDTKNILNIGTAGGWTKASTGYTFNATTKKTKALIDFLKTETNLSKFNKINKFWYYDLLMLDVLANDNGFGSDMFTSLFKKADVKTIFRFLDEESSIVEDLKIIVSVPPFKFTKAFFKRLF